MIPFIQSAFENLIYLFYPTLCAGCQTMLYGEEKGLCSTCRMQLPHINTGEEQSVLLNKFGGRTQVDYVYAYAYFTKKSIVQRLIHQLKYRGKRDLGFQLGRWCGQELMELKGIPTQADMLIPVPIHPRRRQQRGYNQSEWIADGLSQSLGIVSRTDVMERTQFVASQTRKNRIERWKNVADVFQVTKPIAVRGQHVIVIDDVLTTGATLEACVTQLRAAGATTVGIITIAATR
ncbi:ComF family protein [uncultured Fibrella sp.]|uniref:ComF family protein n=1 Tax=uncultured Fibrella sp. TaxID=1284596 RepID=UPI0035C9CA2F